jgi:hypothetical protein
MPSSKPASTKRRYLERTLALLLAIIDLGLIDMATGLDLLRLIMGPLYPTCRGTKHAAATTPVKRTGAEPKENV